MSTSVTNNLTSRLNQRAERLGHEVAFSSDPASLGEADLRKLNKAVVIVNDYPGTTTVGQMIEQSYDTLLNYKPTLAIGHSQASGQAVIITLEKGIVPVANYDRLLVWLDELLTSRKSKNHYDTDTKLNQVANMPEELRADLDELKSLTESWAQWSLFPQFQLANQATGVESERYPGARFGFVAKRTDAGSLITARGSNKGKPSDKDFALVTKLDGKTVHTTSLKRKASLNAPLAHEIFAARPEINYIVHSHILLTNGVDAPNISAPDTQEDWQSVKALVESGANIINQPRHGTLILLKEPSELLPILMQNNIYSRGDAYDAEYQRFLKEDFLAREVANLSLAKDSKVLDLCCGTGASTQELTKLGFRDIDLADGSASMLAEAEKKIGKTGTIISLPDLSPIKGSYDLITMRQAFNYVQPADLDSFAQNIARKLNDKGQFVFTTFAELKPGLKTRDNPEWQSADAMKWQRTDESNVITTGQIMHTQRTETLDFNNELWSPSLDINIFYQYGITQIEDAFKQAGFKVKYSQEANRVCFVCSKESE